MLSRLSAGQGWLRHERLHKSKCSSGWPRLGSLRPSLREEADGGGWLTGRLAGWGRQAGRQGGRIATHPPTRARQETDGDGTLRPPESTPSRLTRVYSGFAQALLTLLDKIR